jgi:glycerol-3-phosphate cytidylyltransferase
MKKEIVGYTCGVYDLFHVGHVNMLKQSKVLCDKLIVGVSEDEIVINDKGKHPVIPFLERIQVVEACKYTDLAIPQRDRDKYGAWEKLKFDILFVGDDWHNDPKWNKYEEKLKKVNVKIVYFPYTGGTSSTLINQILINLRKNQE